MRSAPAAALAVTLTLLTCAAALAASPKPGAVYTGREPHCTTAQPGTTCAFMFRVSSNGKTMRFAAKHNVVGVWACHGGGGEAVLGPYDKPFKGEPVPVLTITSGGAFHGRQSFASGSTRGTITAAGSFTGSGKTATITFTLDPGPKSCTNGPIKLTAG